MNVCSCWLAEAGASPTSTGRSGSCGWSRPPAEAFPDLLREMSAILEVDETHRAALNFMAGCMLFQDWNWAAFDAFYQRQLRWETDPKYLRQTPDFLVEHLQQNLDGFPVDNDAFDICKGFKEFLTLNKADAQFAECQRRDQRGMMRQHAHLTFRTRDNHHIGGRLAEERPFLGDNFNI